MGILNNEGHDPQGYGNTGIDWKLYDLDYAPVATVSLLEDDMPMVIIWQGRTFYYDNPDGNFLETVPFRA